ncbi:MAG TPA: helix-turn-helix domain-containing protein, partial [Methylocella sp.]
EAMANADMKELDRLTLARELLLRKCQGKRGNSNLPRLVGLCLTSPIVSVPFAAKQLKVSQQAATIMIDELSSNLRELTGRGRYRAWAVM